MSQIHPSPFSAHPSALPLYIPRAANAKSEASQMGDINEGRRPVCEARGSGGDCGELEGVSVNREPLLLSPSLWGAPACGEAPATGGKL